MALIVNVWAANMGQAREVAKAIQDILDAEGADGFTLPGMCAPDILAGWGGPKFPVVTSEHNTVLWQGSAPGADVVRKWIVDNAAE